MTAGNALFFLSLVILIRWAGDWTITWAMRWRQEREYRKYRRQSEGPAKGSVGMSIDAMGSQAPGPMRPDIASREDI